MDTEGWDVGGNERGSLKCFEVELVCEVDMIWEVLGYPCESGLISQSVSMETIPNA